MSAPERIANRLIEDESMSAELLAEAGLIAPQADPNPPSIFVGGLGSPTLAAELKYLICYRMLGPVRKPCGFAASDLEGIGCLRQFMEHFGSGIRSFSDLPPSALESWAEFAGFYRAKHRVRDASAYLPALGRYARRGRVDFSGTGRDELVERFRRLLEVPAAWSRFDAGEDDVDLLGTDAWRTDQIAKMRGTKVNETVRPLTVGFLGIYDLGCRDAAREFMRGRFMGGKQIEPSTAVRNADALAGFINHVTDTVEGGMRNLGRLDVEAYLQTLKGDDGDPCYSQLNHDVGIIRAYLEWLQQAEHELAPSAHVQTLVGTADYQKPKPSSGLEDKQTPRYILEQLTARWDEVPEDIQCLISLLSKTGLRISDALQLPVECLAREEDGWWVVLDIQKIRTIRHRVPIDEELAEQIRALSSHGPCADPALNPRGFLFVNPDAKKAGGPWLQDDMRGRVNELLKEFGIKAEGGEDMSFRFHGMRHRYAMSILNSGGDIVAVQELLGHVSSSMTDVYARLTDHRKREVFDAAISEGLFSFVDGDVARTLRGSEISPALLDALWTNAKLMARDTPYGVCAARRGKECPVAGEPPCLTAAGGRPCPYLAIGLSDMDEAKYEVHSETAAELEEIGARYGNEEMSRLAAQNRKRFDDILGRLRGGAMIVGVDLLLPQNVEDAVDDGFHGVFGEEPV